MKKAIKIIITVLLILAVLGAAAVFGANLCQSERKGIYP